MIPEFVYAVPSSVVPPCLFTCVGSNGFNGGSEVPGARKVTVCGSALPDVQWTVSPASTQTSLGRKAIALTAMSGDSAPTRTCQVTGLVWAEAEGARATGMARAVVPATARARRRSSPFLCMFMLLEVNGVTG